MSSRRRPVLVVALFVVASCGGDGGDAGTEQRSGPTTDRVTTATVSTTTSTTLAPTTAPTESSAPTPPAPRAAVGAPVASGDQPVGLAVRPGDETPYVIERAGRVRPLQGDGLGPPVLDITDSLVPGLEQGLLGLAFSPDGRRAYLDTVSENRSAILEFTVDAEGLIDPASRRTVYAFDQPYEQHNGGAIAFGPDGLLYVFTGDGGSVGDPERRGLDLSTPLGKILRIDPTASDSAPFTVPGDNPFVDVDGARPEIWARGLRNPWRASFDPETGDLWIADVGDLQIEEVSVAWADEGTGRGASFGWSAYEGSRRYHTDQPAAGHEPPIYEYEHGELGCSIAGGQRYRGRAIPALVGWYVFGDWCSGLIRAVEITDDRTAGRVIDIGRVPGVTELAIGPDRELYAVSIEGSIHPIVAG